jgi:hypothetical protein
MVPGLRSLVVVAVCAVAQIPVSEVESRSLEWLRSNCVPIRDVYADGPNVTRTCRVNDFRLLGTIDGRDVYYGLYRRLVSLEGMDPLLAGYDQSPTNNTAVAIMEGPKGALAVRVVQAFTNEGASGGSWFEVPELIHASIGDVLFLPCTVSGNGGIRDDRYYLRQGGQWAPIDTAWSRGIRLPRGHWISGGFTDIRSMRGPLAISKPDDMNCCPTGGWLVVTLELKQFGARDQNPAPPG